MSAGMLPNVPSNLVPIGIRGTLTLPDLPGFALDIEPGSATFGDGSKSGVVTVTVVHYDKVPMTPNFGQQPRLVVTIQPEGTTFDPPAQITIPNVDGLAPGEAPDFFSFDHDLGTFVSIGPGAVSEDGSVISSRPGIGVSKAGWHCCQHTGTDGTPHQCPDCEKCIFLFLCVADKDKFCSACDIASGPGRACDGNGNCETGRSLIGDILASGRPIGTADSASPIETEPCPPLPNGDPVCGLVYTIGIDRIEPGCGGVDMVGAGISEKIIPDAGCGMTPDKIKIGPGCPVGKDNKLIGGCRDKLALCAPRKDIPVGTNCSWKVRQELRLDGFLIEIIDIELGFEKSSEDDCSGKFPLVRTRSRPPL